MAALSAEGRWPEAAEEARRLRSTFAAVHAAWGPIPGQAFDGMLAACLARDADELDDFIALVGEIFP